MFKSCPKCGKIHKYSYECKAIKRTYNGGQERELRNSYAWHTKAEEIKERANYLCELCKAKGIYNYNNLETHHITKVQEDPSLLLDNLNLICLCVSCHKLADAGKIDAEYLRELARLRECPPVQGKGRGSAKK